MNYEWDERKRRMVLEARGIDFVEVAALLENDPVIAFDRRTEYGEDRYTAIGEYQGEVYVLSFAPRADRIRLITVWNGGRRGRRILQEYRRSRK